MTGPLDLSREVRIYLAIWRKAYLQRDEETPVSLTASSFTAALILRRGMYRAIRPYRYSERFDEELKKASEMFVVSVEQQKDPKSPHTLVMKRKLSLNELEAELLNLGLDENDLILPEEKMLNENLQEFLKPDTASNPFYTRDR